jgi:hypothetical protein
MSFAAITPFAFISLFYLFSNNQRQAWRGLTL